MQVRLAAREDLAGILAILNREIAEGYAHFGTEPVDLEDLGQEFESACQYPWVVALEERCVVGFSRASPWKSRGAYRRTCEVGVYVRPDMQGQGVGASIYDLMLRELRDRGFRTLLGGISLPNPASVRLHERFGFRHVGTLPSVGWKLGEWRDVGYWALVLDD
jgi:L-amino acid N-acyltransferase YncA